MKCVFCQIVEKERPAYIVYEDDVVMAFLDHRPISRGHLQVVPKVHYRWMYDHPAMGSIFTVVQTIIRGIIPVLACDHVTIGTFGHEVHHAHIWVVPQYQADCHVSEGRGNLAAQNEMQRLAAMLRETLTKEVS